MRLRVLTACVFAAGIAAGEVRNLTLREAVKTALDQNPDVLLARLDEQKAVLEARAARDPFAPKVYAGSGLAYTSGFPMSIEGSAPSAFQARASASIYNLPQRYRAAQARENARGAAIDVLARRDEAVLRAALLYLDTQHAARALEAARGQAASLEKVRASVDLRVKEGHELPIESRRVSLDLARARQRMQILEDDLDFSGRSLAAVLGFDAGDVVRPADDAAEVSVEVPGTEEAAIALALEGNHEVRRLESALVAKGFEARSYRALRYPTVDLVAQYGLFTRFNNYEDFFRRFERHNGQLGVSFQLPLWTGPAPKAQAAQAEAEIARLRLQLNQSRNRIALETRRAFQNVGRAATAREVARQDFELQREQVSIRLAQFEEGRAGLRQVEEARFAENEKWLALLDAQYALARARFELLRRTGGLAAALR
jgi:outer membrane protein TolC